LKKRIRLELSFPLQEYIGAEVGVGKSPWQKVAPCQRLLSTIMVSNWAPQAGCLSFPRLPQSNQNGFAAQLQGEVELSRITNINR
jgi:hypothetical protein